MKPKWKKQTSSNGRCYYACKIGKVEMLVTNEHRDHPGYWIGSCAPFFANVRIGHIAGGDAYARDAQEYVMAIVRFVAHGLISAIDNVEVTA